MTITTTKNLVELLTSRDVVQCLSIAVAGGIGISVRSAGRDIHRRRTFGQPGLHCDLVVGRGIVLFQTTILCRHAVHRCGHFVWHLVHLWKNQTEILF